MAETTPIRLVQVLVVASMCLAMGAQALMAQGDLEHRGRPLAWQYALGMSPGVIRGIVLHENGNPLEDAIVAVGSGARAFTDADGRFEISGLQPGPVRIEIQRIVFEAVVDSLILPSDVGVFVAAVLVPTMIGGRCGDLVPRGDGIFVQVTDSVTGLLPNVPVTIRLERGTQAWEDTRVLRHSGLGGTPFFGLSHRVEEPGEYSIQVSAPGYRPWRLEGVELDVELAVCSQTARNRRHVVRLIASPG